MRRRLKMPKLTFFGKKHREESNEQIRKRQDYQTGFKAGMDSLCIDLYSNSDYLDGYREGAERNASNRSLRAIVITALVSSVVYGVISHRVETDISYLRAREQRIVQTYQQTGTLPEDVLKAYEPNDLERGVEGD